MVWATQRNVQWTTQCDGHLTGGHKKFIKKLDWRRLRQREFCRWSDNFHWRFSFWLLLLFFFSAFFSCFQKHVNIFCLSFGWSGFLHRRVEYSNDNISSESTNSMYKSSSKGSVHSDQAYVWFSDPKTVASLGSALDRKRSLSEIFLRTTRAKDSLKRKLRSSFS